ncbi:TlyA family RNA methyltransferase [Henriciella aquimarina]|uniref:TlyA family RNA methyltransferase n=1 Tax=Henriciella aquimarina TaxID=545261 RepID=UPI001F2054EA|nr:TlyA family RNA methyltransferase [Henriciella aquimarina]
MSQTDRADRLLVALGHYASRAAAQEAIAGGHVRVNGACLSKPSARIASTDRIEAAAVHPWVSRGGLKLAHALEIFGVDPAGRICLDIGASTGGFTDVLLQKGAQHVYAVDVGRGQLHEKVAADERVTALEATDARDLTREQIADAPSLIVCDASFIALEKLLAVPLSLSAEQAELVCLFKPQFQVGRAHVGKGGIVKDTAAVACAEEAFCSWLAWQGWHVTGRDDSPITGGDGNAERLVHARHG